MEILRDPAQLKADIGFGFLSILESGCGLAQLQFAFRHYD
jgi:hypothetical protein